MEEYPHAIEDVQTVLITAGASLDMATESGLWRSALRACPLYTSAERHYRVGPEEKADTSAGVGVNVTIEDSRQSSRVSTTSTTFNRPAFDLACSINQ